MKIINLVFISLVLSIACIKESKYKKIKQFFIEEASIRNNLEKISIEETDSLQKLKLYTKYNKRNVSWCQIVGYVTAYELNKNGLDKTLIKDKKSIYLFSFQFKESLELAFEVSIENDYSTFKKLPTWFTFSKIVAEDISPSDVAAYDSLFSVLHSETNNTLFNKNFDQFFTGITTNDYLDNGEEEMLDSLIRRANKIPDVSNKGLKKFKKNLVEVEVLDEEEYR